MFDCLVMARNGGADVFNALDLMENRYVLVLLLSLLLSVLEVCHPGVVSCHVTNNDKRIAMTIARSWRSSSSA